MAVVTSFSSLVRSGRKSAPKKSLIKIMPDFGDSVDPHMEQAVRTLYDSVYELERRALALEDSGFLTQRVAQKRFGAATTKEQLQVTSPRIVLNVDNLIGVLAQPQKTAVREVTALPPGTSSFDGELVLFGGLIYRFNATEVAGGVWRVFSTAGALLVDTHANRVANFDPADFETGVLFWESDRKVLYRRGLDGSSMVAWIHTLGTMSGTIISSDQRPADLGTDLEDVSFLFHGTDIGLTYQWDGTSDWTYHSGDARIVIDSINAPTQIGNPNSGGPPTLVPVNSKVDYYIIQDGTGHKVTWASLFKGVSALTVGRTANSLSSVSFWVKSLTQFMTRHSRGDMVV